MMEKTAIITGANTGMGFETAKQLAVKGFNIIMAVRDEKRGGEAMRQIKASTGASRVRVMRCDLSSLTDIHTFVRQLEQIIPCVDVLVNNAGVVALKREVTEDGFESMIGVNHLGHFALTLQLLPLLECSTDEARIVNVSSGAHKYGRIHFPDPHLTRRYGTWRGYAQSKLANILFTYALAARLEQTDIRVNALHPGGVSTMLGVDRSTGFGSRIHQVIQPMLRTAAEGAETAVYLSVSREVHGVHGKYFIDSFEEETALHARDKELQEKMWEWSMEQTNIERLLEKEWVEKLEREK
nr:SDR family oxidoreductase [Marinococcus halophilus]